MKSIILIILFFLFCGCANDSKEKNIKIKSTENKSYNIQTIDAAALRKIIDDRNSKLLFINVWATWCIPCVEEFPDVVRIAKDYKNKDIQIITLNTDFVSDIESHIIPFLKENNAELPVYIVEDKNSEEIIELLNKDWSGAIPATIIYDKEGKQRSFMLGVHDYTYFKKSIDSVLTL